MTKTIQSLRLFAAAILAPVLSAILILAIALVFDTSEPPPPEVDEGWIYMTFVYGTLFVGWPAMLFLGLPIHAILCKKSMRRWYYYAGAGALVGLIPILALLPTTDDLHNLTFGPFAMSMGAGMVAAVLFHLIRGPHLAFSPPQTSPAKPL